MFYCDPCADRMGWPKTISRWRGRCEMCERFTGSMSDLPSRLLPDPTYSRPAAGDEGSKEGK